MNHFVQAVKASYQSKGDSLFLGTGIHDGTPIKDARVTVPLKTLNRHGLISGATGTGKTITVQLIAGELSEKGVPVLLMDLKGDLSGIAKAGSLNPKIEERQKIIGEKFLPKEHPVEFLSISEEPGVRLRSTVSEFGPILMSRILDLNSVQTSVMSIVFKYCDDHKLGLVDLADLKECLNYLPKHEKEEIERDYGRVPHASTLAILRKIVALEQQGGGQFFGEKSFQVDDLLGDGKISILRLRDIQDKPHLFTTFMLSLMAEIYSTFPEVGDLEKPKLAIFIDEAHLIFHRAHNALVQQLEVMVKLIRSKGVGIFFCTQSPRDIPEEILGQLGLKIQHALRAFTAKDRTTIRRVAENYPPSDFYAIDQLITSLGIGEALITTLDEKGKPTIPLATFLKAPSSRMGTLSKEELDEMTNSSQLVKKYRETINPISAKERLQEKIETFQKEQTRLAKQQSVIGNILASKSVVQFGKTLAKELARGILGVLGLGGKRRR